MKHMNRIMGWLLACGLAMVMVSTASADTKERTGKVVKVKGAARYTTGNGVWQTLKIGTILKAGALVQTAADSWVDIILGEANLTQVRAVAAPSVSGNGAGGAQAKQDVVRVQADSTLAFDKLSVIDTGSDQVTDTQLDLRGGKVFGTVKKLNATSRYEIKLPNGVAGVRGTVYNITADGVVQVLEGSVVVAWTAPDGTPMSKTVDAGNQFDVRTGLLTIISDSDKATLEAMLRELTYTTVQPPTIRIDNTIYYVSPDTGTTTPAPQPPPPQQGGGEG